MLSRKSDVGERPKKTRTTATMSDIPKFVKSRLRDAASADHHPDPNLLTAFAEQALRPRERENLLNHLAACADCRELFALALPEASVVPASVAASSTWFRWPVLRWAAAGACVVVVGAAISLRFGQHPVMREAQPAANVLALQKSAAAVPEPQKKLALKLDAQAPAATNLMAKRADQFVALDRKASVALRQPASPVSEMAAAAPAPVPAPETGKVENVPASEPRETVTVAAADTTPSNQTSLADKSAPRDEVDQVISGKAKDAEESKLQARPSIATGALVASRNLAKAEMVNQFGTAVVPRWRVSSDGILQRSLDSGQTWQAVTVAEGVTFRAVASIAADVWAGGASGILYHSSDSGRNWTQTKPADNGKPLTADITAIAFTDLQHGQLTTLTGETWTTTDNGQSWRLKPLP